ncbi:hypothetical protein A3B57_03015 [Microgenomates group bacterium RIFCSPLOWO2_01_FULL_47_10]|nr:MAG: hypothetical protein A3B57_03015 [Microgenomates group bacterium RIFCSPLOWO2_01_FULL_47_10]
MPNHLDQHHHPKPPGKLDLAKALQEEQHQMELADVPIVTVSGTFKKELAKHFSTIPHLEGDVLYSRAHYSMAEAVRRQAQDEAMKAYLVDPMNYVDEAGWKKVIFTQNVGRAMARNAFLRWVKDRIDTIARSKLPISEAITKPLLYLTEYVKIPIISMHYEAGNILSAYRFPILQYVTDPHVRPQYLDPLPTLGQATVNGHVTYAVFDEATKASLFALARELGKGVTPEQVEVVGPPVDPRIVALGKTAKTFKRGEPINLAITTGGTGSNLAEIKLLLHRLVPLLKPPEKLRLFLYAGVHHDFRDFFESFAMEHAIRIGNLDDETARIRILFEDSIIDANENLIKYMFPWAHGVVTKPSGDMAYDAAAAGCFLLFLQPLGPWEENIQKIFIREEVGFDYHVDSAYSHFRSLFEHGKLHTTLHKAHDLDPLYRSGVKNLLKLYRKLR